MPFRTNVCFGLQKWLPYVQVCMHICKSKPSPSQKCAIFITPVIPISYSGSAWIISHPPWIKKFTFCSKPLTCSLTRRGVLIFSLKRWCPNAETNYIGASKPVKGIFSTFHWRFVESWGVRSSWVWDSWDWFKAQILWEGPRHGFGLLRKTSKRAAARAGLRTAFSSPNVPDASVDKDPCCSTREHVLKNYNQQDLGIWREF